MAATSGPSSDGGVARTSAAKISCKGVWKLFGAGAKRLLAEHNGAPSEQAVADAGLIGAVRDANFSVADGEIFVIMGLSGSGKSTLVRCMSRLIEPTAGEVIFDGQDLLQASEKTLIDIRRHKMGMVFQHFALLPHLTVLGNVAFPLEVQGASRADREARAREVIELVGLKGRESYYPRELSGGQQQRVGIARSLAVEPEIWLLDEPFSALDPLIRREMQDEFLRLQNMLQKTIVFITHDFDEAIRLADRIAIMKDGAIIQIGTPEALVTNPATDYVAEFTREIPRAKVLSAGAVMTAADPGVKLAGPVAAETKIEDLAAQAMDSDAPLAVIGDDGAVVGQITREVLGVDEVVLAPVQTMGIGSAGSTSASRQTWMSGGAVQKACEEVRAAVVARVAVTHDVPVDDLVLVEGRVESLSGSVSVDLAEVTAEPLSADVVHRHAPTSPLDEDGQGDAHVSFAVSAHRAIVDVDPDLGLVRVVELTTSQDVGRVLNPVQAVGQLGGGAAQGVGLAVMGEVLVDNGRIRNASFTDYLVPTALDMPPLEIAALIEQPEPGAPFGAKGIGEPPCISSTAAVVGALRNATGLELARVPVRPADIALADASAGADR